MKQGWEGYKIITKSIRKKVKQHEKKEGDHSTAEL
jgi:hypothetical protein